MIVTTSQDTQNFTCRITSWTILTRTYHPLLSAQHLFTVGNAPDKTPRMHSSEPTTATTRPTLQTPAFEHPNG
jgi:hypothetical protein